MNIKRGISLDRLAVDKILGRNFRTKGFVAEMLFHRCMNHTVSWPGSILLRDLMAA